MWNCRVHSGCIYYSKPDARVRSTQAPMSWCWCQSSQGLCGSHTGIGSYLYPMPLFNCTSEIPQDLTGDFHMESPLEPVGDPHKFWPPFSNLILHWSWDKKCHTRPILLDVTLSSTFMRSLYRSVFGICCKRLTQWNGTSSMTLWNQFCGMVARPGP